MRKYVDIIMFLLLGALFIYLSVTGFMKKYDLVTHHTATVGYVKDNIAHRGKRSTSYHPSIEFKTADGQTHTFESSFSSNPPKYSVGQPVEIFYDPARADNVEINDPWALWSGPTIAGLFGLAAILFPIVMWIKRRKGM